MSNLFTDMTGIRNKAEYDEARGHGAYDRTLAAIKRITDRMRFFIGCDGKRYEVRSDGVYCDGVKSPHPDDVKA